MRRASREIGTGGLERWTGKIGDGRQDVDDGETEKRGGVRSLVVIGIVRWGGGGGGGYAR